MPDPTSSKLKRYRRIRDQLALLFETCRDPVSRMASAAALLHNKFPHFYWTGFYRLDDGQLIVGPYQGTLACAELTKNTGVCWLAVNTGTTVIVPDVHAFPGHIACDAKSKSEIAVPVRDGASAVIGVLDVDSAEYGAFDEEDREGLENVAELLAGYINK